MATALAAIIAPTSTTWPDWVGHAVIGNPNVMVANCHAALIDKQPVEFPYSWAVTAAHCFSQIDPDDPAVAQGTVFGANFGRDDVFFHPDAVDGLGETWDQSFAPSSIFPAADVALIRLRLPETQSPPQSIKLWHPADPTAAGTALIGNTIFFAGATWNTQGEWTGEAVGEASATSYNGVLRTNVSPSLLEQGDSGGPAWLTLQVGFPASQAFTDTCALPTPASGEPVLVGIAHSFESQNGQPVANVFAPTFHPGIAEWIAKKTRQDLDEDGVCNAEDNCFICDSDPAWPGGPTGNGDCMDTPNPGQENSNEIAERAWGLNPGTGEPILLGDACDPAPTPRPALDYSGFVGQSTYYQYEGNYFSAYSAGRAIHDQLRMNPILDDGPPLSSVATPRFCDCRDSSGKPIKDPDTCKDSTSIIDPHYCFLNPLQGEAGWVEVNGQQASIQDQKTAWWTIWSEVGGTPTKVHAYVADYPGEGGQQPPAQIFTWLYQDDYDDWLANGWIPAGSSDPTYGPGTDLGGAIWFHDSTGRGGTAHGLEPGLFGQCGVDLICSIADGFRYGVAPDPKSKKRLGGQLLVAWKFTLCPPDCGFHLEHEELVNPAPVATTVPDAAAVHFWSAQGGFEATANFSEALRELVSRPETVALSSGEPPTLRSDRILSTQLTELTGALGEESSPRGLLMAPVDDTVELSSVVPTQAGGQDVMLVESVTAEVCAPLVVAMSDPDLRAHLAAAYSRAADALFVLNDSGGATAELIVRRVPRPNLTSPDSWSVTEAPSLGGLGLAPAMVYSTHDWQLWIVDRAAGGWRLRRANASSALSSSYKLLPSFGDVEEAWLTTIEDGRVLVALNETDGTFRLALLSSPAFSLNNRDLFVDGAYLDEGKVLGPVQVISGRVHMLVKQEPYDESLPQPLILRIDQLTAAWPELALDLREPDVEP